MVPLLLFGVHLASRSTTVRRWKTAGTNQYWRRPGQYDHYSCWFRTKHRTRPAQHRQHIHISGHSPHYEGNPLDCLGRLVGTAPEYRPERNVWAGELHIADHLPAGQTDAVPGDPAGPGDTFPGLDGGLVCTRRGETPVQSDREPGAASRTVQRLPCQ